MWDRDGMADYLTVNRANWDERVPAHVASPDYEVERFAGDPGHLSKVVRFDLPRLGDITGARGVHLQCHIGTDTVSLARIGAGSVVGLDFSSSAITAARALAARARTEVEFVVADAYDAVTVLGAARFDLVFTGIGAICWLPSISRWAETVAGLLRPGGRLFIREGHPMLWTLMDPRPDGLLVVTYPYFEDGGTLWTEPETYGGAGTLEAPDMIGFSHGLGEIVTALLDQDMSITSFTEHREVPWNPLGDAMVASAEHPGEYVLAQGRERLPLTYTLQATKRSD
jgi:SAM-dependent methyltransferase